MESAIQVTDLARNYGPLRAVDGISFEIPKGSVCGFVGANGAGKTTTMRILATLDYPTTGTTSICGYDVVDSPSEVRRLIGWMPDYFGNYEHMTVLEYLDFFARSLGYKGAERTRRIDEVMEFTDLVTLADRPSNKLSKGLTQRLGLGRALLHDPQVLIMDEPAAGLDPKARVELKHLIRVLASEGKTIFISSHILSELGEMCDTLLFINQGKIVHHGDAESLKRGVDGLGGAVFDVRLDAPDSTDALSAWCSMHPTAEFLEARKNGGRVRLDEDGPARTADLLAAMVRDGLRVTEFHREQRNLEDAFIEMLAKLDQPVPPPIPTPDDPNTLAP